MSKGGSWHSAWVWFCIQEYRPHLDRFSREATNKEFFFFFGVNFSSLKVRTGVLFLILNIGQTKIEHLIVRFSSRMTKNSR